MYWVICVGLILANGGIHIIIITIIMAAICITIATKIRIEDVFSIDGVFSIVGFVFGMIMTFLNLIYISKELLLLSPVIAITSMFYLRYRNRLLTENIKVNISTNLSKIINMLYFTCVSIALFSYYHAPPYQRPITFFICISLAVALLGLDIISLNTNRNILIYSCIFKIVLLSLILRSSSYFISPYFVGSDPWVHAEYVKNYLYFGFLKIIPYPPGTGLDGGYYLGYPIEHLFVCVTSLIGNINVRESMFIVGAVLVISTVFVFLFVYKLTGHINLALFSMLLLNFVEYHIEWSIEVIAMTFGIAIYTIILYSILAACVKPRLLYSSLLVLLIPIITWTHTISGFIALISLLALYTGNLLYGRIYYTDHRHNDFIMVKYTTCILFIIFLTYHWMRTSWMEPNCYFFDSIVTGLSQSLQSGTELLVGLPTSNIPNEWDDLINVFGFLIFVFFGIIGSLRCLSAKYASKTTFSLILMSFVLYSLRYGFPLLGLQNILHHRWPAFIYVGFVLFAGLGFFSFISLVKYKKASIVLIIFSLSFLMMTHSLINNDSPIYGETANQKYSWTNSEMALFHRINNSYSGIIITDLQTGARPFKVYLMRYNTMYYHLTSEGNIDWDTMDDKLVIWRRSSLMRPVQAGGYRNPSVLLGSKFKDKLDKTFGCIYDTGEARAYC